VGEWIKENARWGLLDIERRRKEKGAVAVGLLGRAAGSAQKALVG
jgi:hypothetical protein